MIQKKKMREREQPTLTHVYFQDRLKAHVHPNSIVRLFCFEMHLLSNAVSWLASTFEECCMTILKMTARETTFFHAWPKHKETVSEDSNTLILFQMEENKLPTSLTVTRESSSRFKLVVNAYGCFVESDKHNKDHKVTKHLNTRWDFLEAWCDCEMFWFLNLSFCVNS